MGFAKRQVKGTCTLSHLEKRIMYELRKKDSLGRVVTNSSGFDSKINQENDGHADRSWSGKCPLCTQYVRNGGDTMNFYLYNTVYTEKAMLPQIMAEDTGAAELRNPVFCIQTSYRCRTLARLRTRFSSAWKGFWRVPECQEAKFGWEWREAQRKERCASDTKIRKNNIQTKMIRKNHPKEAVCAKKCAAASFCARIRKTSSEYLPDSVKKSE